MSKFMKLNKQEGFTLIELLVTIAIIGMISSIVVSSLIAARKMGRDARRVQDIKQINTAIQFYIAENNHAPYLASTFNCTPQNADPSCTVTETTPATWTDLQTELSPFISRLPIDPCGINCYDGPSRTYFTYVYEAPGAIALWCGCTPNSDEYGIFAQNMEVDNNLWNVTFAGVPTFGFVNHQMGSSF